VRGETWGSASTLQDLKKIFLRNLNFALKKKMKMHDLTRSSRWCYLVMALS
jgi:hypothetical protein